MEQLFESPSLLPSSLSQYTHGTTESLHVWKLSRTVHSHPLKVTFKNWAHLTYCGVCQSGGASSSCLPGGQEWSLQHGSYQEWSEWSSLIRSDQNYTPNKDLIKALASPSNFLSIWNLMSCPTRRPGAWDAAPSLLMLMILETGELWKRLYKEKKVD